MFAIASPQRKSILSVRAADRKLPVQITNPTQVCSRGQGAHRSKKNRRETNFEKSKRAISLLSKCSINKQRKRVVGLQRRCGVETAMHRCCKRKRNWLLREAGRVREARRMTRRKLGKRRSKSISIDWRSLMTGKVSSLSAARTLVENQSLEKDHLIKQRLSSQLKKRKKPSLSYR